MAYDLDPELWIVPIVLVLPWVRTKLFGGWVLQGWHYSVFAIIAIFGPCLCLLFMFIGQLVEIAAVRRRLFYLGAVIFLPSRALSIWLGIPNHEFDQAQHDASARRRSDPSSNPRGKPRSQQSRRRVGRLRAGRPAFMSAANTRSARLTNRPLFSCSHGPRQRTGSSALMTGRKPGPSLHGCKALRRMRVCVRCSNAVRQHPLRQPTVTVQPPTPPERDGGPIRSPFPLSRL
jgi:hypothetical protein